jgi:hypothetical protein
MNFRMMLDLKKMSFQEIIQTRSGFGRIKRTVISTVCVALLLLTTAIQAQDSPACTYPQVAVDPQADPIVPAWTPFTQCANNTTLWDPSVIWDEYAQFYRLYFTRWNGCTQHMHIYTTESSDGITWNAPLRDIHDPTQEPSWGQGIMNNFETTSALQLNDSTIYVYFLGYTHANRVNRIGLLISTDYGDSFSTYANNPVLVPTEPWETENASGIKEPSVIYDATDSLFKMWYNVTDYNIITRVGYAWSNDGITWTKHPDNPIFLPLDTKIGEEWPGEVNHVNVAQDPDHGYHLFYANHFSIFQAYSEDGVNWTREPDYYPQILFEADSIYRPCPTCPWVFDNLDAYGSPSVIFRSDGDVDMFLMRTIPGADGYGNNPPGVPGPGGMMLGLATGNCYTVVSVLDVETAGKIDVFPNPTNDYFTFEFQSEVVISADFILRDMHGRIVLSEKHLTTPFTMSKGDLPPGVYIFEMITVKKDYFRGQIIFQ